MMATAVAAGLSGCKDRVDPRAPVRDPLQVETPTQVAPATQSVAQPPAAPTSAPAPVVVQPPVPPKPVEKPVPAPVVATPAQPPLATIDGVAISREAVEKRTMEAHGLNMLLRVAQVEMAKAAAQKEGIQVTPADIAAERASTLEKWFKDTNPKLAEELSDAENRNDQALVQKLREEIRKDHESMLSQALVRQNMTMAEFDLLMQANTHIRKIVEKQVAGKVTEENVREGFNNLYGENVRVRHIQCSNMVEIAQVQQRLAAGDSFEDVARALSRNAKTRGLGGELPPFSRQTPNLPEMFKQVAFSLKSPGEVSDPVEADGAYHLIKLVEHIEPKAVKYEDVKEYVRQQLYDRWIIERMKLYRDDLAKKALDGLKISDPVLAKQFADRVSRRETELKERDQISREITRERQAAEKEAAGDAPVASPAPAPAPAPATANGTEELRPPATQSGSDTPDQK